MKLGVVGLPNVGKSTLFNAITNAGAMCANYPFCTIEQNVGVVNVPDERLDVLAKLYNSKKVTPAILEFVDIAGLVRGASKGEGLGNKFLSYIREVDAIVEVVRCFDDTQIIHVDGEVNPIRDIETIDLELILADEDTVLRKLQRVKSSAKSGDKKYLPEIELLEKLSDRLKEGKPIRTMTLTDEEKEATRGYFLLTDKPIIFVANVSELEVAKGNQYSAQVEEYAGRVGSTVITVCAKLEAELTELSDEDREFFKAEYGITESGLDKLVKAGYSLLGLISYLTAGEKEVRAWTIENGTKAPQAAGKIHSDFEKGFIRAEIVNYDDLIRLGSVAACKEQGLMRSEGKDYVMKDSDVVLFRFNV